jgi:sugar/nucleoside kinase (ribokinase family)
MPDIITVGEILVEVMTRKVGQEFLEPGELLGPYPSGAPAIFIDQAARMGASCGIISRVGDDDFGLLNIKRLENDGVDTSNILETPGYTTGTAFVTYFSDGSRKFIFHFIHSAAGVLSPEDVDEDYIKQAKFLHIMGCSLSTTESMRQAILKAVAIAKGNSVRISFDPNIRLELMDNESVKAAFQSILSSTDILLTGNSEALAITGAATIEETVEILKARGIQLIIIKSGSKGARAYTHEGYIDAPLFKVDEVDPTGAGDCFDGAFVAGLAEGKSIEEALVLASAAGALGVTKKGPMEGAAFKQDIIELVERGK